MPALDPGNSAPPFSLKGDGGEPYSLHAALAGRGALLVFFKTECPTCRLSFPFIERMHRRLQGSTISLLTIGQNDSPEIEAFRKEFRLTLPIALDPEPYSASASYGLRSVPTFFLIGKEGKILRNLEGHSKDGLEEFLAAAAEIAGLPKPPPLFTAADACVKAFQPG